MKKIIAIFLSVSVAALSTITAFASQQEETISSELWNLCYYINDYWLSMGEPHPVEWADVLEIAYEANDYYETEYTDADRKQIYIKLLNAAYNIPIEVNYAYDTYQNSLKEENFDNWYKEDQWNEFVQKREKLGKTLEKYTVNEKGYVRSDVPDIEMSNAFYELLNAYNIMTNDYTVMGDVNKDGKIDVNDVTLVQKYLAKQVKFTGAQIMLCGTKGNLSFYENPDINSVTNIQKFIASIDEQLKTDKRFLKDTPYKNESVDRIYSHTFNYTICPRIDRTYYDCPLDDYFCDTFYLNSSYSELYSKIL